MSAGTTSDVFLRNNLDFLSRAANWSKFTATAALGVIHKGSLARGRTLLGPYLPGAQSQGTGKEFSEGGALFAVGLVNAGRGGEECDWLMGEMKKAEDEVVKHGAALGLGVAGMASASEGASPLPTSLPSAPSLQRSSAFTDPPPPSPLSRRQRSTTSCARRSFRTLLSRARPPATRWASSSSARARTGRLTRCASTRTRRSTRRLCAGSPSAWPSSGTARRRRPTRSSRSSSRRRCVLLVARSSPLCRCALVGR